MRFSPPRIDIEMTDCSRRRRLAKLLGKGDARFGSETDVESGDFGTQIGVVVQCVASVGRSRRSPCLTAQADHLQRRRLGVGQRCASGALRSGTTGISCAHRTAPRTKGAISSGGAATPIARA